MGSLDVFPQKKKTLIGLNRSTRWIDGVRKPNITASLASLKTR